MAGNLTFTTPPTPPGLSHANSRSRRTPPSPAPSLSYLKRCVRTGRQEFPHGVEVPLARSNASVSGCENGMGYGLPEVSKMTHQGQEGKRHTYA